MVPRGSAASPPGTGSWPATFEAPNSFDFRRVDAHLAPEGLRAAEQVIDLVQALVAAGAPR